MAYITYKVWFDLIISIDIIGNSFVLFYIRFAPASSLPLDLITLSFSTQYIIS